eukprot:gene19651-23369_t
MAMFALLILQACNKKVNWVPDDPPKVQRQAPAGAYVPDNSFKIVTYFSASREPDSVATEKYKMMTHLNYAFLYPNADGSLQALTQPARFKTVIKRAKENGVKTAIALAGPEATYTILAASPGSRTRLVKNVLQFVLDNELDGVDMDWEYPRANNGNLVTYEALMVEMADSLHKWHKYLSAAITPAVYAGTVRDGISAKTIAVTDFFNIMVYDGIGWDSTSPGQHASYKMAEASLDVWLQTKGMPKEKAILGFPAYGKESGNAAIAYRDLLRRGADPKSDVFTVSGLLYYYNGTEMVKNKALLAKARANGMMMWELYQDANGGNSLLKTANDALGRKY